MPKETAFFYGSCEKCGLGLQGGITIRNEALTINGTGFDGLGALRNIAGANTFAGNIALAGTARVASTAGTLVLNPSGGNAVTGTNDLFIGGPGNIVVSRPVVAVASLTKEGAGTVTLASANTYDGRTKVLAGTLEVTGSLARNDSESVFVLKDADGDFATAGDGAKLIRRVIANGPYGGLGATEIGSLGTAADIRGGSNNGAGTGSAAAKDVAMQWRERTATEALTNGKPQLLSDVLRLENMAYTGQKTDPFVLQLTYDQGEFDKLGIDESRAQTQGLIRVGWLNGGGQWGTATASNSTTGSRRIGGYHGAAGGYAAGSYEAFVAQYGVTEANLADFLGSWGVDIAANRAWSIVDHNSDFGITAVPEPGTLALLIAAVTAWAAKRRRIASDRRRSFPRSAVGD